MKIFILFGATGDIYKKKIYHALNKLSKIIDFRVIGVSRQKLSKIKYKEFVKNNINDFKCNHNFIEKLEFINGEYTDINTYLKIHKRLVEYYYDDIKCYAYCGVPDFVVTDIAKGLYNSGIYNQYKTIFLAEKPNRYKKVSEYINESDYKLIDHYLGKTSLSCLKPINQLSSFQYLKKVEIIIYESEGVNHRLWYFDKTGLLNDMFQSHMMSIFNILIDGKFHLLHLPLVKYINRGQYSDYKGDANIETYFKFNIVWNDIEFEFKGGKNMPKNYKTIIFHLADNTQIEYPILSSTNEYFTIFNSIIENKDIILRNEDNIKFWYITKLVEDVMKKQRMFIY